MSCSSSNESFSDFLQMLKEIVENDHKKTADDCIDIAPIAFWTQLFANYFLHVNNPHHDDLLFYVKKDPHVHHDKSEVQVFRRESMKNPGLGDPAYDWTETVYLNLILQQLQYKLTCAICSKNENSGVIIHKQVSQTVYASPSRHDMDAKGHTAELSYPNIYFPIDSFDEIWTDLHLNPNEMVCVEMIAHDKSMEFCSVIFLGSVNYEALAKVYEKKMASIGTANKWASLMTMGLYKGQSEVQKHFVKMKGPGGKGYAEMAIEMYKDTEGAHKKQATAPDHGTSSYESSIMSTSKSEPVSLFNHTVTAERSTNSIVAIHRTESEASSFSDNCAWRKPTSTSLRTHLTYVTLPWHKIILDALKSYESPEECKGPVLGT